jgi:hypothetical protein
MAIWKQLVTAFFALTLSNAPLHAENTVFETFERGAEDRWQFITDGVMGGVSEGGATIGIIDGKPGIRLTGNVSTENNGGFLQVRRMLPEGLPEGTKGLTLKVRGNGRPYHVFIRTKEMARPWYYYNARFEAGPEWQAVDLPLTAFERSHAHLSEAISPPEIISIRLFAHGQDYSADWMVREIKIY